MCLNVEYRIGVPPKDEKTLAHAMTIAGYRTGLVGKVLFSAFKFIYDANLKNPPCTVSPFLETVRPRVTSTTR